MTTAICAIALIAFVMMMMDDRENFAYGTSSYIAPIEYEDYGINNPVYSP